MVSERVLKARAMFGVVGSGGVPPNAAGLARKLDDALLPGQIALVTGPSGSGKTSVLRALEQGLDPAIHTAVRAVPPARNDLALVDLFRGGLESSLRLLSRVGLADATILGRAADALSEGERWRAGLALAMERAVDADRCFTTIIADEFASMLDRPAALCLSRAVRRWVSRVDELFVRVVCATAHGDVREALRPEVVVEVSSEE